jgi:mRNA-degrading endonuclease RelE of RelBE toxin-antitoxin system
VKYTVLWSPTAERDLAALWLSAEDRQALTEAANRLDAILSCDAHGVGESRSGVTRILILPPFVVLFDVRAEDSIVEILSVRAPRRTKRDDG